MYAKLCLLFYYTYTTLKLLTPYSNTVGVKIKLNIKISHTCFREKKFLFPTMENSFVHFAYYIL